MKNSNMADLFAELSESDLLAAKARHEISASIIRKRISLDMSQSEFAKHLGVSQSLVSRWESSSNNFSINSLADIAIRAGFKLVNPLYCNTLIFKTEAKPILSTKKDYRYKFVASKSDEKGAA